MENNVENVRFRQLYNKGQVKIEKKLADLLMKNEPRSLYNPCGYILNNGGKRLRPLLLLFSAEAVGGKYKDFYNAALAVELLHNFTLAHDDIMDNSDLRRGKPTVHVKYDINTAILAGDNLIGIAYKLLLKDCNSNCRAVVSSFTNAIIEVCEGQSYDTDFENRKEVSVDEYLIMIKKKTAELLRACCEIGGLLGHGNVEQITALKKYGLNLGMAFQFQDDILDIIGDEKKFGKPIGSDLIEGKKTFMFLRALEKAKGKDKSDLKLIIKNKGIDKTEVAKYREMYERLGIIDEARTEIHKYTKLALAALRQIDNNKSTKLLTWLANSLIKRNY